MFEVLVQLSIGIFSGEDKQQCQMLQMCNIFVANCGFCPKIKIYHNL